MYVFLFVFIVIGVAKPITILYFWSFVIIAYFILFNMVLAVIFTVYDEEYDGLKKEEKLEAEEESRLVAELDSGDKKKDY
jgi:fatty acid desaturase